LDREELNGEQIAEVINRQVEQLVKLIRPIEREENRSVAVLTAILNLLETLSLPSRIGCLEIAKRLTQQGYGYDESEAPSGIYA